MRSIRMRTLLIASFALTLGACAPAVAPVPTAVPQVQHAPASAPAPTQAPVAVPTAVVVVKPTAPPPAAPTPTFERVSDQEPRIAAPQPHGQLTWRDDT